MIESILLSLNSKCFTYNYSYSQITIRQSNNSSFNEIREEFLSIVEKLKQNGAIYSIKNGYRIVVRPY